MGSSCTQHFIVSLLAYLSIGFLAECMSYAIDPQIHCPNKLSGVTSSLYPHSSSIVLYLLVKLSKFSK